MTYGDDRTAGAMSDDERRDYVRQDGAAMAAITTERGPGVPDELRERVSFGICMALHQDREYCQSSESGNWNWIADLVVAEIDAAGYVIVPTDRLERLIEAATMYESDLLETCGQYTELTRQCTSVLELGDLERIGGGR